MKVVTREDTEINGFFALFPFSSSFAGLYKAIIGKSVENAAISIGKINKI
jgi:hypothetical protein